MNHSESKLQQNCVKWFDLQYPALKSNFFSIPNEGARSPQNGARMKAQGRRAGVADMFLAVGHFKWMDDGDTVETCYGIFIEFKSGKGKQTETQIEFEKAVKAEGYRYKLIYDFDQFKNLIETYLN